MLFAQVRDTQHHHNLTLSLSRRFLSQCVVCITTHTIPRENYKEMFRGKRRQREREPWFPNHSIDICDDDSGDDGNVICSFWWWAPRVIDPFLCHMMYFLFTFLYCLYMSRTLHASSSNRPGSITFYWHRRRGEHLNSELFLLSVNLKLNRIYYDIKAT